MDQWAYNFALDNYGAPICLDCPNTTLEELAKRGFKLFMMQNLLKRRCRKGLTKRKRKHKKLKTAESFEEQKPTKQKKSKRILKEESKLKDVEKVTDKSTVKSKKKQEKSTAIEAEKEVVTEAETELEVEMEEELEETKPVKKSCKMKRLEKKLRDMLRKKVDSRVLVQAVKKMLTDESKIKYKTCDMKNYEKKLKQLLRDQGFGESEIDKLVGKNLHIKPGTERIKKEKKKPEIKPCSGIKGYRQLLALKEEKEREKANRPDKICYLKYTDVKVHRPCYKKRSERARKELSMDLEEMEEMEEMEPTEIAEYLENVEEEIEEETDDLMARAVDSDLPFQPCSCWEPFPELHPVPRRLNYPKKKFCWHYPEYRQHELDKLVPTFESCKKSLYTKCDYEMEKRVQKQLIELEYLFRRYKDMLDRELNLQAKLIDELYAFAYRYILMTQAIVCLKTYPEQVSIVFEKRVLKCFQNKKKQIKKSNDCLCFHLKRIKHRKDKLDWLIGKLDMFVESTLLTGDIYQRPLLELRKLVEDIYQHFKGHLVHMTTYFGLLSPSDDIAIEDYKAIILDKPVYKTLILSKMEGCKCRRCQLLECDHKFVPPCKDEHTFERKVNTQEHNECETTSSSQVLG